MTSDSGKNTTGDEVIVLPPPQPKNYIASVDLGDGRRLELLREALGSDRAAAAKSFQASGGNPGTHLFVQVFRVNGAHLSVADLEELPVAALDLFQGLLVTQVTAEMQPDSDWKTYPQHYKLSDGCTLTVKEFPKVRHTNECQSLAGNDPSLSELHLISKLCQVDGEPIFFDQLLGMTAGRLNCISQLLKRLTPGGKKYQLTLTSGS